MKLTHLNSDSLTLKTLAHFIFVVNSDPVNQISYFGDKEEEILHFLGDATVRPSDSFVLAYDEDKLVGALGFDYAPGAKRVFLFGPLITHPDWQSLADELWSQVEPRFPAEADEIEIFCNLMNQRCQEFAERHEFPRHGEQLILRCGRENFEAPVTSSIIELTPEYYPAASVLHEQLFPKSYLSGAEMIASLDATHKLWGAVENGQLLGYTFCQIEEEFGEANIEYVGVSPVAQGRGLGSQLVRTALGWFFSFENLAEVFLVTDVTNLAAIRVYQKAGFRTLYTTRTYRKPRIPSVPA